MLVSKASPKSPGSFVAPRTAAREARDALYRGGDPDFMTSLARGLHVIRAFSGADRA